MLVGILLPAFRVFETLQNFVRVFETSESIVRVFEFDIGEIRKVGQVKIGKRFPNFPSFPSCPNFRPGPLLSTANANANAAL